MGTNDIGEQLAAAIETNIGAEAIIARALLIAARPAWTSETVRAVRAELNKSPRAALAEHDEALTRERDSAVAHQVETQELLESAYAKHGKDSDILFLARKAAERERDALLAQLEAIRAVIANKHNQHEDERNGDTWINRDALNAILTQPPATTLAAVKAEAEEAEQCGKCGGSILSTPFANQMSEDMLAAALGLHEYGCNGILRTTPTEGGKRMNTGWTDTFTPTTEQVRDGYAIDPEAEYRDPLTNHTAIGHRYFDRWLAEHDKALIAERDAALSVIAGVRYLVRTTDGNWLGNEDFEGLAGEIINVLLHPTDSLAAHDAEVAAKALFDIGLTSGSALIAKERRRQIEGEGYDTDADAGRAHALVDAAVCYAHAGRYREGKIPMSWPWAPRFWKPTGDPVRNLVKAGALIAAAIDSVRSTKVTEGATT